MFKSGQLIKCSVLLEGRDEKFFYNFVYASNYVEERKQLGTNLRDHHDSPLFRKKAWMICGDFNEVLASQEHSNYGHTLTNSRGMQDFQEIVLHCSMLDLGYQGPIFTWCNKKDDGLVC